MKQDIPSDVADHLCRICAGTISDLLAENAALQSREAGVRREERERCAKVADAEPELPGHIPQSAREALDADPAEFCRAIVRTTKRNIAKAIRALSPSQEGKS